MKRIQKLIPDAIQAVELNILNAGSVNKEFNGYISSFGASIISAGLLPSVIFFSQKGEEKAKERHKIIIAIEYILQRPGGILYGGKKILNEVSNNINNQPYMNQLTEKITDAAISLKLAIRIYPKSKN
jgi:CRISPR/Cas system CMR-associated protein Cmr5 small subunit